VKCSSKDERDGDNGARLDEYKQTKPTGGCKALTMTEHAEQVQVARFLDPPQLWRCQSNPTELSITAYPRKISKGWRNIH
jgi:hypothetical protein